MTAQTVSRSASEESALTILFGGTCCFVPHEDGKAIRVLLPGRDGGWVGSDQKTIVPPHRAFIKFRMSYFDPTDSNPRLPDFVYSDGEDPVGICFLEGEILTVGEITETDLFIEPPPAKSKEEPSLNDARSFGWVADISRICDTAEVTAAYLGSGLGPRIAAQMDITAGVVETAFIPEGVCAFEPEPDKGWKYQQRLAGFAGVSTKVAGKRAVISSSKANTPPLGLKAIDRAIRIEVLNEVLEDIILPSTFWRPVQRKDFDFEMAYDITNVSGEEDKRHWHTPVRIGLAIGDTKGGSTGECKPPKFKAAAFPIPPRK